jgi:hypothetical protein
MLFQWFKSTSRSQLYKKLMQSNPDWEEQDELKEYKNLSQWFNMAMKSSEAIKSIKKFDAQVREQLTARVNQ